MKVRCDIEGLDCPHCAAKLETLIAKAFDGANLNFSTGSLVIDTSDEADEDEVVEQAMKIAANFEDGITITLRD